MAFFKEFLQNLFCLFVGCQRDDGTSSILYIEPTDYGELVLQIAQICLAVVNIYCCLLRVWRSPCLGMVYFLYA
jgi:hypothetical protein